VGDSCTNAAEASSELFNSSLIPKVMELVSGRVREAVLANTLTTFSIGGALRALVTVESERELQTVRALLSREGQPVEVLGFGSNLLVSDSGIDSWVIKLGTGFRSVEEHGDGSCLLGGSVSLMAASRRVSGEGLSGLEFAAGIPASLGGAVFMNAGAHGGEIAERIVRVRGVLPNGKLGEWSQGELPWRYRSSGLPAGVIVTSVELRLVPGDKERIARACADNLAHRRRTQPLSLPSAGSVFKNPSQELPAGKVLEMAGCKGLSRGGARVSELHANWIVNPEKTASASDVIELVNECIERVAAHSGVRLEPEVRMWERGAAA
jgi:UDP-N-acetylmuramate dehydrogenase